ncbi:hypothetical protein [Candidatus Enterovibrio escicola]|uniref:hypothetical protein n=1 Tax=Candidatus Enterovibrio escicola TaxID=1927127 RepID=UPI0012380291|nr:hypothetical protein [Candidatus Enterovibrio escacola]
MKVGLPRVCLKHMVTLKKEVDAMEFIMGTLKEELTQLACYLNYIFLTLNIVIVSANEEVFYVWIEQDLLPKVPEQAIIVMDYANLF